MLQSRIVYGGLKASALPYMEGTKYAFLLQTFCNSQYYSYNIPPMFMTILGQDCHAHVFVLQ